MEDQTGDDKKLIGKRSHKLAAAHLTAWIALTIYAAFLFTRGREKPGFVVAILVYIFISLRLLAQHVSVSQLIYTPLGRIFDATVVRGVGIVPAKWRLWIMAAALIVTAAIVSVSGGGQDLCIVGVVWGVKELPRTLQVVFVPAVAAWLLVLVMESVVEYSIGDFVVDMDNSSRKYSLTGRFTRYILREFLVSHSISCWYNHSHSHSLGHLC